ncbi:CocE/NonD family hydrolase [soil metagenome]
MHFGRRPGIISLVFIAIFTIGGIMAMGQQPATQPAPVEVKIDPRVFDAYIGQYEDKTNLLGLVFSIYREGEKFFGRVTGQDPFEMFPLSETKFFLKVTPAEAEFVRDPGGKVVSMAWRQGPREFSTKRTADAPEKDTRVPYKRIEAMIPMRDGVKLFTVIVTPEKQTEPAAILLDRTPYGVKGFSASGVNRNPELVKEGYAFVYQDIRGRYGSEGQFIMNRPMRDKRDPKSVDESTDTYDTIEYLIKNIPNNNGRVGIYGVSYPGWLAAVALVDPHPALKASSPQAPMTDTWMGDDFFHNGAWRQSYGHEYVKSMETNKEGVDVSFDIDAYDWYLNLKTVSALTAKLENKLPTYNAFVAHPAYDDYWKARAADRYLKETNVPTLVVGGWWDQEDMYGALATYKALERFDKQNKVSFVMGPWNHGGWNGRGRTLGAIDFGSDTGKYFREEIQAPFFACQLKLKCDKKIPEASIFESGSNKWMSYDSWPPKQNVDRNLYFQANGKLSFDKPVETKAGNDSDSYISDPANPVPYRKRPIQATYDPKGSGWRQWLVEDQQFVADRKDVLRWQTDVLTDDTTISGDVIACLYAATTGTDSDWVVKLIDVYPDSKPADEKMAGYQLMVAEEIFRGRYRKSWEKPEAMTPNKPAEYTVDLRGNDHTFLKGHRIMVQVQSTWFPLYDRNPQTFVDNIFLAKESDYRVATQSIFRSVKYPSHISVSVPPGK